MRGITPARLLAALLATATAFVAAKHPIVADDCCPKDTFCCGNTCQPDHLAPKIFCTLQVGGCCQKPKPEPEPQPDDCCPEGKFCCGGSCLPDHKQPFVKCRSDTCCRSKPLPLPIDPPAHDQKQCCKRRKEDRTCCDGKCYGPDVRFVQQCKDTSCGCPDDEPKPWPRPQPHPKPLPQPQPWPKPALSDCCPKHKVCCGFKCISKWRAAYSKCAKIAGGCCRRKEEKREKKKEKKEKKKEKKQEKKEKKKEKKQMKKEKKKEKKQERRRRHKEH